MKRALFCIGAVVAIFAATQTSDATDQTPLANQSAAPPISAPVSIGKPHTCLDSYPKEAIATFAEGTTILGFKITPEGTVRDIAVVRSSGNDLLDAASVTCSSSWRYNPALRDGTAVEVPWKAQVIWKFVTRFAEPPRDCARSVPVTAAMLTGIGGITELDISITGDAIEDVAITHSSGNKNLDMAAIQCVKTWHFQPLMVDGHPDSRIRPAVIIWKSALTPVP